MKKLLGLFAIVALMFAVSSCGGNNAEAIAKKIQDGTELTSADYDDMISYLGDASKEAMSLMQDYQNGMDPEKLAKKGQELEQKYQYAELFGKTLDKAASAGKLSDSQNQKLMDMASELGLF